MMLLLEGLLGIVANNLGHWGHRHIIFAPFNQGKDYAHFDDSLPTAMAKESKAYRTLLDLNWRYTVSHTMLNLQEVY